MRQWSWRRLSLISSLPGRTGRRPPSASADGFTLADCALASSGSISISPGPRGCSTRRRCVRRTNTTYCCCSIDASPPPRRDTFSFSQCDKHDVGIDSDTLAESNNGGVRRRRLCSLINGPRGAAPFAEQHSRLHSHRRILQEAAKNLRRRVANGSAAKRTVKPPSATCPVRLATCCGSSSIGDCPQQRRTMC